MPVEFTGPIMGFVLDYCLKYSHTLPFLTWEKYTSLLHLCTVWTCGFPLAKGHVMQSKVSTVLVQLSLFSCFCHHHEKSIPQLTRWSKEGENLELGAKPN